MSVIDRIEAAERQADAEATAAFDALVARVAGGDEPDVDEAAAVLANAGKTPADLRSAVNRTQGRQHLVERRLAGQQAEAEAADIDKQLGRLAAEFEAAQRRYAAAVQPLQQRKVQLDMTKAIGFEAEQRLRQTAPEHLAKKIKNLAAERSLIRQRRNQLAKDLEDMREAAQRQRDRANDPETNFADDYLKEAASLDRRAAQVAADLAAADQRQAAINEEEQATLGAMLEA